MPSACSPKFSTVFQNRINRCPDALRRFRGEREEDSFGRVVQRAGSYSMSCTRITLADSMAWKMQVDERLGD